MTSQSDTSTSSVNSTSRSSVLGPDFFELNGLLADAIIEECIPVLSKENLQYLNDFDSVLYGSFITPESVSYIFTICARIRLPEDVKYFAVDIFDKFMCNQTVLLHQLVSESDVCSEEKWKIWGKSFTVLSRQLTLRICTAIQIASKIQSYHNSLSKTDIRKSLTALGFPYTQDTIMKSELRMLSALDFSVENCRSPSQHLENYLALLLRNMPELQEKIDVVYRYGLFVIDFVFLNRTVVYTEVLRLVYGENPVKITTTSIRKVAQDYCLLGVAAGILGVVCTFGHFFDGELISKMSRVSSLKENDIRDMVNGVLDTMAKSI
uniref:Cyclin N-terminal domain-containing protein n=1 Tax=Panagrolaimus sp. JU765 TaxID=591449 RepID=A0AC34QNQ6_9BILA